MEGVSTNGESLVNLVGGGVAKVRRLTRSRQQEILAFAHQEKQSIVGGNIFGSQYLVRAALVSVEGLKDEHGSTVPFATKRHALGDLATLRVYDALDDKDLPKIEAAISPKALEEADAGN